jgi:hypothetical protein
MGGGMGGPPRGGFGGGPGFGGRGGFGGGFGGGPGAMGGRSQIFVSNVSSLLHNAMSSQANNIYSFPTTWAGKTSRTCSAKVVSTREQSNLKLEHP